MEWRPTGWSVLSTSVNLPLHHKVQKFSSGTGSPGWSWKKGRKTIVVVVVSSAVCVQRLETADDGVDVDIEGGDDKKEVEKKALSGSVEEVEVEEFFVKYKNL